MHTLKFRAWDRINKRMWAHEEINIWQDFMTEDMSIQYEPLMQYTGLKDKNGTEIYEGDIIRDRSADRREQEHVGDAIPGGYYKEPLEPIINEDVYHVHFEQGCFVFGKDYVEREFPNPLAFAVEDESDMETMINYFNMPNNEQAQNEDFDYLLKEYNLDSIEELQKYLGAEVIGNIYEHPHLLKEE